MRTTKILLSLSFVVMTTFSFSQSNTELVKHFEKYKKQMQNQADVQGVINAMTHLEVLQPSQSRRDTLAYIYMTEGKYFQALNTIGTEKNATDSDMNVEVKAIALKSLNKPKLALEHFEELYKRKPNAYLAYEMADLKLQTEDVAGAKANIEYGLANVTDEMKRTFYETQQPYQTSLKAAFLCLKGLALFTENQSVTNIDKALKLMNDALAIDSNFNLARITREALEKRKAQPADKK